MNDIFNTKEYKTARKAYIIKCMVEYFVTLLVEDAFLSKLLAYLKLSDAQIGVISSFLTFAFLARLFTIPLKKWRIRTKNKVLVFDVSALVFFTTIYFIPFLPIGRTGKKTLVMLFVIGAYLVIYAISSISWKWFNSFVDPIKRASYSAVKEVVSLSLGIVFSLGVSYVFDFLDESGKTIWAFFFFGVLIAILYLVSFVTVVITADSEEKEETVYHSLPEIMHNTLGKRDFRNVIILSIMIECGRYFTYGFMGIFKTGNLAMTLFATQIVSTVAKIVRMGLTIPLGKYTDKNGFAKGMQCGLVIMGVAFFVNMFLTENATFGVIVVTIFTVLYEASMAGTNQNLFNISYNYVSPEYMTEALALRAAISGICGFGASVVGGAILNTIQHNGNTAFGMTVYGQQVLSAISFVIIVMALFFCRNVVCKQKITVQ